MRDLDRTLLNALLRLDTSEVILKLETVKCDCRVGTYQAGLGSMFASRCFCLFW